MKLLVPAILIVALAAGAFARVLTADRAPHPSPPVSESDSPESTSASLEPVAESETASEPATLTPRAPEGSLDGRLSAALEELPEPKIDLDQSLGGIVIDGSAGTPLPGVRVKIVPVGFEVAGHRDVRESLQQNNFEQYIADRVAHYRFGQVARGETITDENGMFQFEDLPFASYRVEAKDPSGSGVMKVQVDEAERAFATPGSSIVIERVRNFRVAFDVRRSDGSSPSAVRIVRGTEEYEWTPQNREFQIPGGRQHFAVVEDGNPRGSKVVTISGDRLELPIVLEVGTESGISLTVTFPPDEPATQFRGWSAALPAGIEPDAEWILRHGTEHHLYSSRRDVGGVKSSPIALPQGDYVFAIGRTADTVDQIQFVTVPENEMAPLEMELPPIAAEAVIEVWAYDSEGVVIKDASYRLSQMNDQYSRGVEIAVVRRPDGSAWLRPPESVFQILSGEISGSVQLSVDADGYPDKELVLVEPFAEIHFTEPATLFLEVGGATDLENLQVTVVSAEGQQLGSWGLERFDGGVGPLETGEVLIQVSGGQNRWGGSPLMDPQWLTLRSGENHASITLAQTHELLVEVPDVKPGQEMMLFRVDGEVFPTGYSNPIVAELDGKTFRFESLLAGRYSLLLGSEMSMEFSGMEIDVLRDSRMTFAGTDLSAVLIRLSELSAADIPFKDGDKLIGVNGKEFSGIADMAMVFEGNLGAVQFMVIRDGQQIEVETSAQELGQLMQGGGQIVPVAR